MTAALGALILCATMVAHAQRITQPTIEALLGAPFPDWLTAAPVGARIAWVQESRGVRNLWVADGPGYTGRPVTHYTEDDGQELHDLAWTASGTRLVYVRGGTQNRHGEPTNPAADAAGTREEIWAVDLDGGAPALIGPGDAPTPAPRGDLVAYLLHGQIYAAHLGGDAPPAPLVLVRGSASTLCWSPDGSRLAFVSEHGDHSYVGIYTIGERAVRFIDPSVDTDIAPAWSPDGSRIAFVRQPASHAMSIFFPTRVGHPWSIHVAELATGKTTVAWRADTGTGSVFRNARINQPLVWSATDRLVFPWERDGWTRLYAVPATGGSALRLTPGDFEVESMVPSPDGRSLLVVSNQDDLDRRHIWRVPTDAATPVPLTSGSTLEWSPAPVPGTDAIAFLRADSRTPTRVVVAAAGQPPHDVVPLPATFPTDRLVEPQPVTVVASDGLRIHAQLFLPPGGAARHPALLYFHGGPRRQMLLGWHNVFYYEHAYAMNQYLATHGYVVLSVNYRSGIGYGLDFREARGFGPSGATEFADVMGAAAYLKTRPDIDTTRIGAWGGSYGGYLTALALARASDTFRAGVDFHGVHDWNTELPAFYPSYDPLREPDIARLAATSSPMANIASWRAPVLVVHGDDDGNVPFSQTVSLVEALRDRGVDVEEVVLPNEPHEFLRYADWLTAFTATAAFLDAHLMLPSTNVRTR